MYLKCPLCLEDLPNNAKMCVCGWTEKEVKYDASQRDVITYINFQGWRNKMVKKYGEKVARTIDINYKAYRENPEAYEANALLVIKDYLKQINQRREYD